TCVVECFSLAAKPPMIGALSREHCVEKVRVQRRPQFVKLRLMHFQHLLWANTEQFDPLQDASQRIHVLVPEIKLSIDVGSHNFSLLASGRAPWGDEHIKRSFASDVP